MIDPTLTISIDRSGMSGSPAPLVLAGDLSEDLVVVTFAPPAKIWQYGYAPGSADIHGSELTSAALVQALLGFSFYPLTDSETAMRAAQAEVEAALAQFRYAVTTQISGAPAEVWTCDPGSVQLVDSSGRTYADLANTHPKFSVSIPVYPIPGS